MDNIEKFFNEYSSFYDSVKPSTYDYIFIDFLKSQKKIHLLDVGGGSGVFACLVKKEYPKSDVVIIDPSTDLLNKIPNSEIKKIQGSLPDQLNIHDDSKFNIIHIKEVLHHITNKSINESQLCVIKSLNELKNHSEHEGYLLIHEIYYESPLYSTLSRTIIFYLLRLQNQLHIKWPSKEFLSGLQVCFYTRREIKDIVNKCGFEIVNIYEYPWGKTFKKYPLFIKDWGRILIIAKNRDNL